MLQRGPYRQDCSYEPISFGDLPAWSEDDFVPALRAFAECRNAFAVGLDCALQKNLADLSATAFKLADANVGRQQARRFFEHHFILHRVVHADQDGLLTGYYEPPFMAARQADERFHVPIYRRPADLVDVAGDDMRTAIGKRLTHVRTTDNGFEPLATRSEIDRGALQGAGLELLYLECRIEAYVLHVQGAGLAVLPDGSKVRVGYDGSNGFAYSSVGQYVVDRGWLSPHCLTLDKLTAWLRAEPDRGRAAMWHNQSFIFFKELGPACATAVHGVNGIALTAGRSVAVDAAHHAIGLPVYVTSPAIDLGAGERRGFARLMVAQDVGSAIRGPERADIYFGSGPEAGRCAGQVNHRGNLLFLLPKGSAA